MATSTGLKSYSPSEVGARYPWYYANIEAHKRKYGMVGCTINEDIARKFQAFWNTRSDPTDTKAQYFPNTFGSISDPSYIYLTVTADSIVKYVQEGDNLKVVIPTKAEVLLVLRTLIDEYFEVSTK